MQSADFQRFKALMTGIAKLYEREIDGVVMDAYWVALRDWGLMDFEAACGQLMRTSTFMPRPADFEALRKAGRPTAGEAWAQVLRYVRSGGGSALPYWNGTGPVAPEDPLILRAVRAVGGWQALGMTPSEQMPFLEKRFAEHFEAMQEVDEVREALPQLTGRLSGPQSTANLLGSSKDPQ